jgi:hypothetical protein
LVEKSDVFSVARISDIARYHSHDTMKLLQVPGLSETTKGEQNCKTVLQIMSELDTNIHTHTHICSEVFFCTVKSSGELTV